MIIKIILPKSGMGIEDGTIAQWLKNEGDVVERGQPIVEVETAKALQEVEAPVSGKLIRILATVGETVLVHAALGEIEVIT